MNLIHANPLTLALHYLSLFIYGTLYGDLQNEFSAADRKFATHSPVKNLAYDFIVVGGGSAGAVVASRLSEENYSVLLLEAGGNPFPLTSVTAFPFVNQNHPNLDWTDKIAPQKKACHSFKNNAGIFNRGKVLGGSSTLNFMQCMRGNARDYDRWAEEAGDDGWSYENMLPFFKKLENYGGEFPDDNVHGTGGPQYVSRNPFAPLREEWLEAGKELGYKVIDPNGHQTESFFPFETTTKGGTRFSTHRGYLYPALTRPNLTIRLYSTVTKIQLNAENKAVGVEYEHEGKTYTVGANKEIIVSSGAVGSPKLLMLSGIGPKEHLESLGIKVKVDLPVGQNLQDHQMTWVGPFTFDETKVKIPITTPSEVALHEYILNGTGPFSGTGVGGGSLKKSSVSPGWPDIYLTTFSFKMDQAFADLSEHIMDFKEGTTQKYFSKEYGKFVLFIVFALGLPKTRGEIKLTSSNPSDPPHLDPNYFDHDDDATVTLEGIKWALEIAYKTKAMKKIGLKLTDTLLPGCEHIGNSESDEYWKCFYKHWTSTMWHYSCSNRMGKSRENSVVDSNLRVWGTKGLRVADASIMPFVTNTNTNIPTIAIGEKASDLIKKMWTCSEASNEI